MILVISSKNSYATKRLLKEARVKKQELRVMNIEDLLACDFKPDFKFNVLYIRDPYVNSSPKYLPQVVKFAKKALKLGVRVVDANIAKGKIGEGKWTDYQELNKAKILIPHTVIASASEAISLIKGLSSSAKIGTHNDTNYSLTTTNLSANKAVYPLVLKWIYGMGGKNTFLIRLENQLKKIFPIHPRSEWLVQEYIDADFEYKVICVGFKALPVVLKIKFNKKIGRPDFEKFEIISPGVILSASERACLPAGRESLKVLTTDKGSLRSSSGAFRLGRDGTSEVVRLAEQASRALGRELSKVDILEKDGKFYVLEVNRFPGLKGFEKLTKYNAYAKFLEYLRAKI